MSKDIPEIDDLTRGINDSELILMQDSAETHGSGTDKTERLVCKLDRDLADSLDDCDIHGRCRSDLVNAIVRAFFKSYLPRLAEYRREKKSLFNCYNL